MKTIDSLIDDIYRLVDEGSEISKELTESFAKELAEIVADRLSGKPREPYLRLSNLGTKCDRRLWLEIRHPELLEKLSPEAKLKFLIGDLHEAILLFLAEASGHKVEGKQDRLEIEGVPGHRDAIIDGITVDVKSASPYSFLKFQEGLTEEKDAFGYITQLNSYMEAGKEDSKVVDPEVGAFLASEKVLGKLTLDVHRRSDIDVRELAREKKEMLSRDELPPRAFSDVPDGKSGNRKLDTYCAYCPVKNSCWPGLQVYAYSNGPRFLTKVVREPKVSKDDPF